MKGYGAFAKVYDTLTKDVDYFKRCNYIEALFEKFAVKKPELVCDLACGTGSMCELLYDRGYDMIGIDISADMLDAAISKKEGRDILYLNQDICDFELYGTVDAFLCLLDSVNHLTDDGDLDSIFALVNNYLNPDGIFIFDVNTGHKFENVLADNTFTYEDEDIFYVWENSCEDVFCDMYITFFVKDDDDRYQKIVQQLSERYYSESEIKSCAEKHNLKVEGVFSDLSFDQPDKTCERQFWVLRKSNSKQ